MDSLYFQGKWVLMYGGSYIQQAWIPDFSGLIADAPSINPMTTFILYAPDLEPGELPGQTAFINAIVQLQGNMNFVTSQQLGTEFRMDASATDVASATPLNWEVAVAVAPNPPTGAGITITVGTNTYALGILNGDVKWLGYEPGFSLVSPGMTMITTGLYTIMQTQDGSNLDFSYVDLSGQNFSAVEGTFNFANCKFQHAILDEVVFGGAPLTSGNFSNASLVSTDFTGSSLAGAIFSGATLTGTRFLRATVTGCNFSGCDLTKILFTSPFLPAGTVANFNSATLPFALINLNWQNFDLRGATVTGIPSPLSTSTNKLQATGAMLSGMNQNKFRGMSMQYAVLDNALLDNLDLSAADLTNASLNAASLHNTTLDDAMLANAILTGAQLGSLAQVFSIPFAAATESALNADDVTTIAPLFLQNKITLSGTATLSTAAANRVWELNDVGNNVIYTIRLETQSGNTQVFNVYKPAPAASLANAYLPGANLSGANLYGVIANNIQFYGSGAVIDEFAILENAELNGSNLSGLDLTQAQLIGTNLSGSYLFNSIFKSANLTASTAHVADLSDANLQGADFTDAQLYSANLTNAAIAISTPTNADPDTAGVYLFSLPTANDTHSTANYETELNAAATRYKLSSSLITDLEQNNLSPVKTALQQLVPPISLSSDPTLKTVTQNSVWQIVDTENTYTLWTENNQTELYVAQSLTITMAGFAQNEINLLAEATSTIDSAGQQWIVDNDSENPANTLTGYITFLLKLNGNVLDVYGTTIRILRLAAGNPIPGQGSNNQLQEQYDTETCLATVLTASNMDGNTICPNGSSLSANQEAGGTWASWMRASTPPKPPSCVPTPTSWCKPTTTTPNS